jgi:hypothetical protein
MALFRRSSSDAHWSKDYIEHLRSVHFVLIAVAVTCIAVSRTPDIGQLENAQTQIHQLLDVAEIHKAASSEGQFVVATVATKTYFSELPSEAWVVTECNRAFIPDTMILADHWEELLASKKNLSDLAEEWNDVSCDGRVLYLLLHNISSNVLNHSGKTVGTIRFVDDKKSTLLKKGYHYTDLRLWSGPNLIFPGIDKDLPEAPGRDPSYVNKRVLTGKLIPGSIEISDVEEVDIPFHYETFQWTRVPPLARWRYMHVLVDNWACKGSFSDCFQDLVSVGRNRTQYSLKDLASYIDGLVANQSKDFEVVGIKFPKEDLTRWGIILLCSILVYFCLHLRELSPKISARDEGLDVAWLGLYPSWYSESLVWLSLVVLPSVAVVMLGKQGAKYEFLWSPQGQSRWARVIDWLKYQPWGNLTIWIFLPLTVCATLGILSCLSAMKLAKLADTARTAPSSEDEPC